MSDLRTFCRQVRERSQENRRALALLHGAELYGQVVGILRQELDSMIRVIYLLSVSDRERRAGLISDAVHGRIWRHPSAGRVTDREMLELAEHLHGWARSVYRFGCAVIHLSSLHDYRERDPVLALSPGERDDLVHHLRAYHGGPQRDDVTFEDVVPYLPPAFEKVASNLEAYLEHLARHQELESHELESAV
jgi:hypothetical protein